jgi:hypothetical protein
VGRGALRVGAGAAFLEPKSPPPEDEPPRRERCVEKKEDESEWRCSRDSPNQDGQE